MQGCPPKADTYEYGDEISDSIKGGISSESEGQLASRKGVCSIGLVST